MSTIPTNAKRVFKGVIFDVYQWEQKMFDGSYKTFEMLKRPDTVEVIATAGDKIMLLDQSQPHYPESFLCLPGGRVDEGEEVLDAVKRELLEETGYASDEWELYNTYHPYPKIEWNAYCFVARNAKEVAKQYLESGEKIKVEWVSFDDFLNLPDNDRFHRHGYIKLDLVRAKYDPVAHEVLKKKLFG